MDVAYGCIFILLACVSYGIVKPEGIVQKVLIAFVLAWGIRLSLRIFLRHRGKKEDFRYAQFREEWMKKGIAYFYLRSFLQVALFQHFIIGIVVFPVVYAFFSELSTQPALFLVGALLWGVGFSLEAIADFQLDSFSSRNKGTGAIMTTGLFRYSRRPNYFGESLLWWGIACVASSVLPTPLSFIAFLSPMVITYIVVVVTGPMLERRWNNNPLYSEYAQKTSYFIPLPPLKK